MRVLMRQANLLPLKERLVILELEKTRCQRCLRTTKESLWMWTNSRLGSIDDPSYQRELLAHDILNSIGVPASRVAHANVEFHISGDGNFYGRSLPQTYNMGVYQMVEQVDKPFLKRYFGKNGYLFKIGGNADLAGSAEADLNCVAYEDAVTYIDRQFLPNWC